MALNKISIKEVKIKHQEAWLKLPHVVSVGLGLNDEGEQVITLGLKELKPEILASYPNSVEGFKVELQEVGTPKAF